MYLIAPQYNKNLNFGITVIRHGTSPKALTKYIDTCALCGDELEREERTFDHFLPTQKGGKTEFKNGIVLCEDCNSNIKKGKLPSELFEASPQMEENLVKYLQLHEVKDLVIQGKKKEPKQSYTDVFRAHAEQVLGRPLKG